MLLGQFRINEIILIFADILSQRIKPSLAIMSGFYPNTESHSYFDTLNIFDIYVSNYFIAIIHWLINYI